MRRTKVVTFLSVVLVVASLAVVAVEAQRRNKVKNPYSRVGVPAVKRDGPTIMYENYGNLPEVNAAISTNWRLHNLDLLNGRFSTLDQINTSNANSLVPRWIFHTGVTGSFGLLGGIGGFNDTPLVVDGVMYITDGQGSVYAADAATGARIWKFDVSNLIPGGEFGITNRGVVYGDGVVYVVAGPSVFAIDAKTGKGLESFGPNGESDALLQILNRRFPDVVAPIELGYAMTMAPQFYNGVVIAGTTLSENHIPGGILMALDAKTGQVIWKFNDVPQGPEDDGWDIAGPTWVGGVRNGGGIWETPAIDPELGTLFFHVGNPSPDFDGSARKGMNLFTDSLVALDVITGELKWFFQEVHHDLWDYDGAASPILFDFRKDGQTIKAVATAPKNGSLYILDRTTGQPINPIIEVPVPTFSDVPGEEIFPTQPMPFTADGTPMEPIVSLLAVDVPPQYASFVVPHYTPPSSTEIHIVAPHDAIGGTNFAPLSFSPRTGLLYVTGMDLPRGDRVQPVGATIQPGQVSFPVFDEIDPGIRNGYVVAYDPATARLVWKRRLGVTQSGVVVTGGDVLFVGDAAGFFYALDARTGDVLYQFQTGAGIGAAPMVYELNGVEYVSVAAGGSNRQGLPLSDSVVTFTLFGQP